MKSRYNLTQLGVLLAVLSATGFSLKAIFVKQAYMIAPIEPITLLSLRMIFALPFFLLISLHGLKSFHRLSFKEVFLLSCLGVAGYYAASILDFMGLEYISAGLERIILFSYPILTIFMGVIFLGQSFEKRLIPPILLTTLGVLFACISDLSVNENNQEIIWGIFLIAGSAISYAFYQAFSEPMIKKLGSKQFSVLAMLVSILAVELHFFIQLPVSNLVQPMEIYTLCFMMALFSTVLPVFLQSSAIKYIGAARVVLISTIGPALTIIFGWLILDEPITMLQIIGMVLVLAGVLTLKAKRKVVAAESKVVNAKP
ncbi:DMT family transporter [Glaciecola sp. 1036]|uniref:DMT family transporter n=1 Tax=Alteromonadaceae TaxID=72275 RepID=UPI003D03E4BE